MAKKMKTTLLASLMVLALGSALAQAGGMDAAGGNATPEKPATPEQILAAIADAKAWALPGFFKALEVQYVAGTLSLKRYPSASNPSFDEWYALIGRFFTPKQGPAVLELLPNIKWDIRTDAPCIDELTGQESDGSVTLPDGVCLSVYRMALPAEKRNDLPFTEHTAKRRAFSLIVHEISHLFDASQKEAEKLQAFADSIYLSYGSSSEGAIFPYINQVGSISRMVRKARQELSQDGSFARVCEKFSDLENPIARFIGDSARYFEGFAVKGAQTYLQLNAVIGLGAFVMPSIYCNPKLKQAPPPFDGRKEIKLANLLHEMFKNSIGPSEPMVSDDEGVSFVRYGDRKGLDAVLARMEKLLE